MVIFFVRDMRGFTTVGILAIPFTSCRYVLCHTDDFKIMWFQLYAFAKTPTLKSNKSTLFVESSTDLQMHPPPWSWSSESSGLDLYGVFFGESHNPPSNLNQHGWGWVEGKPAPMANSMAPPSQKELTSGFHVTKWKLVFPGFDLSSFVLRRNSTKKHGLQLVQFVYCMFFCYNHVS